MAVGAIVVGAIKIYIRHYLLVIDMMEFEVFTIPLMDDKISARGLVLYWMGSPYNRRRNTFSAVLCACVILYFTLHA